MATDSHGMGIELPADSTKVHQFPGVTRIAMERVAELLAGGLTEGQQAAVDSLAQTAVADQVTAQKLVKRTDPGVPAETATDATTYVDVDTDKAGRISAGVLADGTRHIPVLKADRADLAGTVFSVGSSDDFVEVEVDAAGRLSAGLRADGSRYIAQLTVGDLTTGGASSAEPWDIVFLGGQSNGTRTDYTGTYLTQTDPRVLQWNEATGKAEVIAGGQPDYLGWAFARYYAREHLAPGRKVVLVYGNAGGTGFSSTSLDPAPEGYSTTPNGTWDRNLTADPLNLYLLLKAKAKACIAAAPAGSQNVAFLWSQGENDRWKADAGGKIWYTSRLDDLIATARADFAGASCPVLVSSMTPETMAEAISATMNAALLDTPRRVLYSTYIYGPENQSKYGETIHWASHGHTRRGELFSRALNKARMNYTNVNPTPPLNLTVRRSGTEVAISWEPPFGRATAYTVQMSTDSGATWTPVALAEPIQTTATATAATNLTVWVRASTTNELATSAWSKEVKS